MAGLRRLTEADADQALELSTAEGWNQTKDDWLFLIRNAENVCLAFEVDRAVVATATAIVYQKELAWIGMVLVHQQHRGKGYSKLLFSKLLETVDFTKFIQLDATPAGLPVYKKFGFKTGGEIYRMVLERTEYNHSFMQDLPEANSFFDHSISELIEYDLKIYGVNRSVLIEYLISTYPDLVRVLKDEDQVSGYLLGRKGMRFLHLGPLIASGVEVAKALLINVLSIYKSQPVVVDISEIQIELKEWLENLGFVESRYFHRMYLNEPFVEGNLSKQFLISGPEFG
ncbi:MAG TPA: GNAT family N-acetyltransferase [Mariniphaga sp.]|nr:GNAT family N-acetyltransferase [Mariniphaga sp.]